MAIKYLIGLAIGFGGYWLVRAFGVPFETTTTAIMSIAIATAIGYPIGLLVGYYLSRDSDVDTKTFGVIAWANLASWLLPAVGMALAAMTWQFHRRSEMRRRFYSLLSCIGALLAVAGAALGGEFAATAANGGDPGYDKWVEAGGQKRGPGKVDEPTSHEVAAREAIAQRVREAVLNKDFAALNGMETEFRTKRLLTPSGGWKLSWFYRAFADPLPIGKEGGICVNRVAPFAKEWMSADPGQPGPYILQARALLNYGGCIRGDGSAHETPPQALAAFVENANAAGKLLEARRATASMDPQFYAEMIRVYTAQGRDKAAVRALLDEATEREPYYLYTYFEAVQYFLPRWHGQRGDIDWLRHYAARRTSSGTGMGAYTQILVELDDYKDADLTEMDWPTARRGMEDLFRAYPSDFNAQIFASLACQMKDSEAASPYFAHLARGRDPALSSSPRRALELCGAWTSVHPVEQQSPDERIAQIRRASAHKPRSWERCRYAAIEAWEAKDLEAYCKHPPKDPARIRALERALRQERERTPG